MRMDGMWGLVMRCEDLVRVVLNIRGRCTEKHCENVCIVGGIADEVMYRHCGGIVEELLSCCISNVIPRCLLRCHQFC
jgi:hypothetical protein